MRGKVLSKKMDEAAMKAAAKQVDPPLLVPDDSMLSPIRMSAGSLNYYRSGNDSVSWHSDDEEELGKLPIIGSLSFGGVRRFRFRNKRNKNLTQTYELQNGSLLLMKGATQKFWEHEVPKTKKKVKGRINLTFRFIV